MSKKRNSLESNESDEPAGSVGSDDVEPIVENAPPQIKRTLERVLAFGKREEHGLPANFYDAVGNQINDKHFSAVIQNADNADRRLFIHSIIHNLIRGTSIIGFIAVLVLLTVWLARDDRDLYL